MRRVVRSAGSSGRGGVTLRSGAAAGGLGSRGPALVRTDDSADEERGASLGDGGLVGVPGSGAVGVGRVRDSGGASRPWALGDVGVSGVVGVERVRGSARDSGGVAVSGAIGRDRVGALGGAGVSRAAGVERVRDSVGASGRWASSEGGVSGEGAVPVGLLDGVRRWLAESGGEPTPARVAQALREQGRVLGDAEVLGAAAQLRSELVGSGPLESLLADPSVTDVLVSAPDRVWVDRGGGLELTTVSFPDAAAVRRLAQRLAAVAGRRLDDARPWADARLPDGTRLHAVLPPVAVGCTCLSLRVVRPRAFTLDELVTAGTVPPGGDRILRALIEARLSFLISGGTGSGKTTLLSALLGLVGPGERIVLAEDSAELKPDHPHVVRLESRPANQEGAGLVTLQDLVRQALRMRPDRLVVGEVRGPEVVHLLAALNTGHEGGCGTVHANAAADVPARLEALGTAAGLDRAALHSQLAAALSVVLHLVRDRAGRRRIAEVHVLERDASGLVRTVPALRWGVEAFAYERGWERLRALIRGGGDGS